MDCVSTELLAKTINDKRNSLDMSIDELSNKSGVDVQEIRKLEKGFCIPNVTQLERIMPVLGFQISDIVKPCEPAFQTAFRSKALDDREQESYHRMMEMMLVAKKQIALRKAIDG